MAEAQLRAQLWACQQEKAELEGKVAGLQRRLQSATDEISDLEAQLGAARVNKRKRDSLDAEDAAKIKTLEQQLANCKAQLLEQQEAERRRSSGGSHPQQPQQPQQPPLQQVQAAGSPAGGAAEGGAGSPAAAKDPAAVEPASGEAGLNVEMLNVWIGLSFAVWSSNQPCFAMAGSHLWLEPSRAGGVVPAAAGGSGAGGAAPPSLGEGRVERFPCTQRLCDAEAQRG